MELYTYTRSKLFNLLFPNYLYSHLLRRNFYFSLAALLAASIMALLGRM